MNKKNSFQKIWNGISLYLLLNRSIDDKNYEFEASQFPAVTYHFRIKVVICNASIYNSQSLQHICNFYHFKLLCESCLY